MNNPLGDENFYTAVRSQATGFNADNITLSAHPGYLMKIRYRIPYPRIREVQPAVRPQNLHQVHWVSEVIVDRLAEKMNDLSGVPIDILKESLFVGTERHSPVGALQFTIQFASKKLCELPVSDGLEMICPLLSALKEIDGNDALFGLLEEPFEPVKKKCLMDEWLGETYEAKLNA